MMQNPDVQTFEELIEVVKERKKTEMFFRIDVKPPFATHRRTGKTASRRPSPEPITHTPAVIYLVRKLL